MHKYNKNFLLLFSRGEISGYGHYKRSSLIEKYIKKNITSCVKKICIRDEKFKKKDLDKFILDKIKKKKFKILILDFNNLQIRKSSSKIKKLLVSLKEMKVKTIGIDSMRIYYKFLDYVWIPSPFKEKYLKGKNIFYGWNKMIFRRNQFIHQNNNNIIVTTGASKNRFIRQNLAKLIEKNISKEFNLHWLFGKYSEKPKTIDGDRWIFHRNISSMKKISRNAGFVFSLYGLSLFEALSSAIPTAAFCTKDNYKKDFNEISFFKKKNFCFIENDITEAVKKLNLLTKSKKISNSFIKNSKKLFKVFDYSFLNKI